jgi:GTP-binding protein
LPAFCSALTALHPLVTGCANDHDAGSEEQVRLTPALRRGLEDAIGYVRSGELIEVTPSAVRMRKRNLDSSGRKTAKRKAGEE